jgi:hypothetical protein
MRACCRCCVRLEQTAKRQRMDLRRFMEVELERECGDAQGVSVKKMIKLDCV